MKATGITRKIDGLGRFVIPKELRRAMSIEEGSALEIFTDEDSIVLKKYERGCIICGESKDTTEFKGKLLCKSCKKDMIKKA